MYETWGLQSKSLGKSRNFNTAWKAPRGHTLAFSPIQNLEASSIAAVKGLNFSPSSSLECTFNNTHLHSVIKKFLSSMSNTSQQQHEIWKTLLIGRMNFPEGWKIFRTCFTWVFHCQISPSVICNFGGCIWVPLPSKRRKTSCFSLAWEAETTETTWLPNTTAKFYNEHLENKSQTFHHLEYVLE